MSKYKKATPAMTPNQKPPREIPPNRRGWVKVTCILCRGSGRRGDSECPLCEGRKEIVVKK